MKLGIIIYSVEAETVWNAFRLGVFALGQGDQVRIFLLGMGVECEQLDTEQFVVTEQMKALVDAGGEILACGTCIEIRQEKASEMCPISTMKDLHTIVAESDRLLTF